LEQIERRPPFGLGTRLITLKIRHKTIYRFHTAVSLGPHRLMLRPPNRSVGGFNLIPVAVVRDISQAMPVSGSFVGRADAFAGMSVEVLVTS
jgi:hypothetical protein